MRHNIANQTRVLRRFSHRKTQASAEDLAQSFTKHDDRSVAVIAGSLVDNELARALKKQFRKDLTEDEENSLFDEPGPLSTFAARIKIAYALEIIGTDEYKSLNHLRSIRNAFAHSENPLSFLMPEVANVCALFKLPIPLPEEPRGKYIAVVLFIMHFLEEKDYSGISTSATTFDSVSSRQLYE